MSGIVAIVNADGAPVDRALLGRMTDALAFRGPDALRTHAEKNVGFTLALLSTDGNTKCNRDPFSIEDDLWLTGDMRLDDRETLSATLRAKGRNVPADASDADLLLAAYRIFGSECVNHLRGDFAFAIWDNNRKRLFCARDHFGIKPLFYFHIGNALVVCSSLNALRLHPRFSDRLNDQYIAEFLAFNVATRTDDSVYADVSRVPPAHTLLFENNRLLIERYWKLPVPEPVRYRCTADYPEHFRELLDASTADRVRSDKISIFLSGGLDSTSIAASAIASSTGCGSHFHLRGFTTVFDRLIPDNEREYTAIAADHLGMDVSFFNVDENEPYSRWGATSEPIHEPFHFAQRGQYSDVLKHSRIVLSGHGGDESLTPALVTDLLGHQPAMEIAMDTCKSLLRHGRRPAFGLRALVKRSCGVPDSKISIPDWIRPELVTRFELDTRENELRRPLTTPFDPGRRDAYLRLSSPFLTSALEREDANFTKVPVESRYPYLDLRLVNFLLAVPPVPWCIGKLLTRESMQGRLPNAILRRPKSPLAEDPLTTTLRASNHEYVDNLKRMPELEPFIDVRRVPDVAESLDSPHKLWQSLAPASLALWFEHRNPTANRAN